ncbi:N-acetyltransferase family protein, partial [Rhizobium johnstonii]|uniref:GNAT family N-acetyltransferase n=1 Tax=Rhizobium johnstonii TaxID=3019933 RepID=UPI003F9B1763
MPAFANNMNLSIMTDAVLLRDATESDLSAIRDIYNHAVEHTTAIWNDTLVDLENRRKCQKDEGKET